MLGKLKQLLASGGTSGPKPSGLCLWQDLTQLDQLAKQLATEAEQISDWEELRRQLQQSRS